MSTIYPSAAGSDKMGSHYREEYPGTTLDSKTKKSQKSPIDRASEQFAATKETRRALCIGSQGAQHLLKTRWKVTIGSPNRTAQQDLKIHFLAEDYTNYPDLIRSKSIKNIPKIIGRTLDNLVLSPKSLRDKEFHLIHIETAQLLPKEDALVETMKFLANALKTNGIFSAVFLVREKNSPEAIQHLLLDNWVLNLLFRQLPLKIKESIEEVKSIDYLGKQFTVNSRHILAEKI